MCTLRLAPVNAHKYTYSFPPKRLRKRPFGYYCKCVGRQTEKEEKEIKEEVFKTKNKTSFVEIVYKLRECNIKPAEKTFFFLSKTHNSLNPQEFILKSKRGERNIQYWRPAAAIYSNDIELFANV